MSIVYTQKDWAEKPFSKDDRHGEPNAVLLQSRNGVEARVAERSDMFDRRFDVFEAEVTRNITWQEHNAGKAHVDVKIQTGSQETAEFWARKLGALIDEAQDEEPKDPKQRSTRYG